MKSNFLIKRTVPERAFFVSLIFCLMILQPMQAQSLTLRGLEIYNPFYHNPAYTQAERTVQLDLLGYNFDYYSGIWTSAMVELPRINSAAGIRFGSGWYTEVGASWNLEPVYVYRYSISEDLQLNGGIAVNYGHTGYEDGLADFDGNEILERYNAWMRLGASVQYKKWHVGLSTHLPLYVAKGVRLPDGSRETQTDDFGYYTVHFLSGYSFGTPGKLTIDPVLGLDYYVARFTERTDLEGYLGARLEYRNLVGLGFTFGNLVSVSTSLNLKDRVSLIIGIYAGEHELFSTMGGSNYTIGSNDFNIIAQLRIHL